MTENFLWLIIAIYFEARNQSFDTKVKIGHAVMNRVKRRGISVKEVVAEPNQFPWYNKILTGEKVIGGDKQEVDALIVCAEAAFRVEKDRMNGEFFFDCDHFYDDSIEKPYWAPSMTYLGKYDDFYFFKS